MIPAISPVNGALPLVCDLVTTVTAAYSLRKVRAAYAGNCIKVRRSSDNAEADIGFAGAVLDTAALLTHCGAGNGFVTTWYDQSANGYNVTQTTAGAQPQIVVSGAVHTENGKPALKFDGSDDYLTGATAANWTFLHYGGAGNNAVNSAFFVGRIGSAADPDAIYAVYSTTGTSLQNGAYLAHDTRASVPRDRVLLHQVSAGGGVGSITLNIQIAGETAANTLVQVSVIGDPANATAANRSVVATNAGVDRKASTSTGTDSSGDPWSPLLIGAWKTSAPAIAGFLNGAVSELLFYNADKTANRTTIYTNQNAFYTVNPESIYNLAKSDGFLDTTDVFQLNGLASTANDTLDVTRPTKYGSNPLIDPTGGTWDWGFAASCVIKVGSTYKMWYAAYSNDGTQQVCTCYQTSSDGDTWSKGNLGLVTYAGNTNNNIIVANPLYSGGVHYEAGSPAYSMILAQNGASHVYFRTSADGITFTLSKDLTASDYDGFTVIRRPSDSRWLVAYQTGVGSDARSLGVMLSDTSDQTGAWTDLGSKFLVDGATNQKYIIGLDYQFGLFLAYVYHYNSTTLRIFKMSLHVSRDGVTWTEKDNAWLEASSTATDWDYAMIYPGNRIVRVGNVWRYYYGGSETDHSTPPFGFKLGYASLAYGRMGRASGTGSLTTKFITAAVGESLLINADGTGGTIKCELTDTNGAVITGYAQTDFDTITTDVYDHVATWGGVEIPDSTYFKITFHVAGAILYSYSVE